MKKLLSIFVLFLLVFLSYKTYAQNESDNKYYIASNVYITKAGSNKGECENKIDNIKSLVETAKNKLDTDGNVKYNVRCLEKS